MLIQLKGCCALCLAHIRLDQNSLHGAMSSQQINIYISSTLDTHVTLKNVKLKFTEQLKNPKQFI